jgi:hypothetical protein
MPFPNWKRYSQDLTLELEELKDSKRSLVAGKNAVATEPESELDKLDREAKAQQTIAAIDQLDKESGILQEKLDKSEPCEELQDEILLLLELHGNIIPSECRKMLEGTEDDLRRKRDRLKDCVTNCVIKRRGNPAP